MTGWLFTLLYIAAFIALAVAMERRVANRWYEHLIITILALLLIRPELGVTGDMSAVLPDVWSSDTDGKDQIILVSLIATLTIPIIAASSLTFLGKGMLAISSDAR